MVALGTASTMPNTSLSTRSIQDRPDLVAVAVRLMRQPTALAALSSAHALCVVSYMRLVVCPEGGVLLREGEQDEDGGLLLVLDGEVTVENTVPRRGKPVVVTVLGPGHLIGEMGLLDGGPRTASCIATTPVVGAGLSRLALRRMMDEEPAVAVRLLAAVSQRMAQRLRDANRKMKVYHQLSTAMQGEIDTLQQQLQQVMDGAARRQAEGHKRG